jgi:hypothetical protein
MRGLSQRTLTLLQPRYILLRFLPRGWGYLWTTLPTQAIVGSKLRSAARGLTLGPTSDCGGVGFESADLQETCSTQRNGFSA